MSAGVAHAHPGFVLGQSQARAGDVVHFSITNGDDWVTYEIEVADRDVAEGEGDGDHGAVSGQFTMPDLGAGAKSVQVEAEIRDDDGDDRTTVKRKLQYLGQAIPVKVAPAAPQAPAAPAAPQQTAPAVAPAQGPTTVATPAKPATTTERRRKRVRRKARQRRAVEQRQRESGGTKSLSERSGEKRRRRAERNSAGKAKHKKRPAPRTAPLFDGVPEPGSKRDPAAGGSGGSPAPPPAKPPTALLTVAGEASNEPATAILVPGLMALAGFILAGATLLRKRRTR